MTFFGPFLLAPWSPVAKCFQVKAAGGKVLDFDGKLKAKCPRWTGWEEFWSRAGWWFQRFVWGIFVSGKFEEMMEFDWYFFKWVQPTNLVSCSSTMFFGIHVSITMPFFSGCEGSLFYLRSCVVFQQASYVCCVKPPQFAENRESVRTGKHGNPSKVQFVIF